MSDKYRFRYQRWQRLLKKEPAKAAHHKKFMIRNAKRDLKRLKDEGKSPDPWLQKIVSESKTRKGEITPAHTEAHSANIGPGMLENLVTGGTFVIPGLAGVKIVKAAGNIFKVFKGGKQIGGNYKTGNTALNYVRDRFKNIITPRRGLSTAKRGFTPDEKLLALARATTSKFRPLGRTATQNLTAAEKLKALQAAKKGIRDWAAINQKKPGGVQAAWKKLSGAKKATLLAGTGFAAGVGINEVIKLLKPDSSRVSKKIGGLSPLEDYKDYKKRINKGKEKVKTHDAWGDPIPKSGRSTWDKRYERFPLVPYGDKASDKKPKKADSVEDKDKYDFGAKPPKFEKRVERKPGLMPWNWIKLTGPRGQTPGLHRYDTPFGEIEVDTSDEAFDHYKELREMGVEVKKGGQIKKSVKKVKARKGKSKVRKGKPKGVGVAQRGYGRAMGRG